MSKITIATNDVNISKSKNSDEILTGTVFTGDIGIYSSLFVACYQHQQFGREHIPFIVNLKNPSIVWEDLVRVENYREVDITITIED